jgi:polyisoprenoid-binding protein YceI
MNALRASVIAVVAGIAATALAFDPEKTPATPAAPTTVTPAPAPAPAGVPAKPTVTRQGPVTPEQPPLKDPTTTGTPPETAASGKSLVVPEADKKLGTVFYAIPGKSRQAEVHWAGKNEPADKAKPGASNGIIGYAVAGPEDAPYALKTGWFKLPVKSIDTQIPMRNDHLQGEPWLDAAKFPDIAFQILEVTDIKAAPVREGIALQAAKATIRGNFTIKGVTREVTLPGCDISLTEASGTTASYGKGNLLAIRRRGIKIPLAEFGITNDAISKGAKVAETTTIDLTLVLSDVAPEDQTADAAPKKEGAPKFGS